MEKSEQSGDQPPQGLVVPAKSLHEIRNALSSVRIILEVFRKTDSDAEGHNKLFVMLNRQMDQLEGLLEPPLEEATSDKAENTGE